MTDPTLSEILARLTIIEAQQGEILQLLRHGVTPPEWVSAKALAVALGLRARSPEYWRNELGVIPVDGRACRKMGKRYKYRVEECRRLIEEYKLLPPETQRQLRQVWQDSKPRCPPGCSN